LDCGSPLPLLRRQFYGERAGEGLPQSRTLTRDSLNPDQFFGSSIFETALKFELQLCLPNFPQRLLLPYDRKHDWRH
jgi:hypothetical protein